MREVKRAKLEALKKPVERLRKREGSKKGKENVHRLPMMRRAQAR